MNEGGDVVQQPQMTEGQANFAIPDAYQGKGYVQNIKSVDDLWREVDTLYPLVGKKSIPTADSPPEAWEEFYTKMRPESADKYNFALPEGFDDKSLNQEELGKYKELFHKAGLTPKQAQMLFDGELSIKGSAAQQSQEQIETQFKDLMSKTFGEKQSDAMRVANQMMLGLPDEQQKAIQGLPNEQLVAVVKLLNDTNAKFSREDVSVSTGSTAGAGNPVDVLDKLTEAKQKLRSMNFMTKEYKEQEELVNSLREQHRRLQP